jgi:urease accessory protein
MNVPLRVHLPFAARSKSRLLVDLDNGERAALIVARGRVLKGGDRVTLEDGRLVEIVAADESLIEARSDDPKLLARAAYHLGNRHVAVQFVPCGLRFPADHVLAQMIAGLGLEAAPVQAPFEPEGGAYGQHHTHGDVPAASGPKIHSYVSR